MPAKIDYLWGIDSGVANSVDIPAERLGASGDRSAPPLRDSLAFVIAAAAITLFVGTGGAVMSSVVASIAHAGIEPDRLLVSALLLNIALILFGWNRYRQLAGEVAHRRVAEADALRLAETDPLTGFLNRRSLAAAAEGLLAQSRARGEAVAFLMIDLDNFKAINDIHGHGAGDMILSVFAGRIAALLPERTLAARLGGDEFACLVPFEGERPERIGQLAEALIEAAAEPVSAGDCEVEITISIGIARSDRTIAGTGADETDRSEKQALMQAADVAMYHAKKHGRNRYFWFEAPMEGELRFRRELETGIRRGIPHGEFVPYYEQQVDLKSGKLVGFEMLARWNSPAFGLVSPEVFIPVAEEMGAIGELSTRLIAQALQDAKEWDPQLTLSVNISPVQLRDPWFAQKLLKLLVEANFPPQRLEIEITESCLHENIGTVRSLISSLKNQGVHIVLDDFGTGYSSLGQLRSLPFDRIKIDRTFVTNLAESQDSETIVRTITSLGEGLGLPVTAEGIESEEILSILNSYGEFRGQGYYYGKPETAEAAHERLAGMDLLKSGTIAANRDRPAQARPKRSSRR